MAHKVNNTIVHNNNTLYIFINEQDPRIDKYINRINTQGLNLVEKNIKIYPILIK